MPKKPIEFSPEEEEQYETLTYCYKGMIFELCEFRAFKKQKTGRMFPYFRFKVLLNGKLLGQTSWSTRNNQKLFDELDFIFRSFRLKVYLAAGAMFPEIVPFNRNASE